MQILSNFQRSAMLVLAISLMAFSSAFANPGDSEAVAKARKDYAQALKTKDIGRINAMKIELSVQLSKQKAQQTSTSVNVDKTASK